MRSERQHPPPPTSFHPPNSFHPPPPLHTHTPQWFRLPYQVRRRRSSDAVVQCIRPGRTGRTAAKRRRGCKRGPPFEQRSGKADKGVRKVTVLWLKGHTHTHTHTHTPFPPADVPYDTRATGSDTLPSPSHYPLDALRPLPSPPAAAKYAAPPSNTQPLPL